MKKVNQTIFGPHGNCFAACLASLLELPIEQVPNFHGEHREHWITPCRDWLKQFGLFPIVTLTGGKNPEADELVIGSGGICIAGGLTERGTSHACIYQGLSLIWDPHPSALIGLTSIEDMTFLVPIKFEIGRVAQLSGLFLHLS